MCCHHLNRRQFLGVSAGAMAGVALASVTGAQTSAPWAADLWDPDRPFRVSAKPLRVQPVLMYHTSTPREAASWKSWGGVQSEQAAREEAQRIAGELDRLAARAGFPISFEPPALVATPEQARQAHASGCDAAIVYPATGSGEMLRASFAPDGDTLVFVRHRSGPVYYWYEALSVRYLETGRADLESPNTRVSVDDVVVDEYDELLWRLRALSAIKNFRGARIVALGGAAGKYASDAPEIARKNYGFQIDEVGYDAFEPRLTAALADPQRVTLAETWTDRYLAIPKTELETQRPFVVNSFVLYGLFKELMEEHEAAAFTIGDCMATIMPMAKTTACLTLSLMNDAGLLAFCESDFVIIPAGVLLYYVTGHPVFLHNSTFPHKATVTCAHCTGPRRMDGDRYDPARILTHYESEYGAAPKVAIPEGQQVTFIDPEYATGRWLGFTGIVRGNPFYDICRSQQDVEIQGDWKRLLGEVRDSHWMMAYGDHLAPAGYAARKTGIRWETI